MRRFRHVWLGLLLIGGWIPQTALSKTVTLVNSSGESTEWEVEATDQFLDVVDRIQSYFQVETLEGAEEEASNFAGEEISVLSPQFDLVISHAGITARAKKTQWRDYDEPVAKQEKKDITYIVTTLGNESLISIGTAKSSLKKAGDRIDHLHPLRFLMTVFTDERLKAGIHAIRDRGGWIWSGFIDGLVGSLNEEGGRKNLLQFVPDFASKVKIDPELILPALQQGKWSDFVNILIDKIPRETDPNRYDM